MAPPTTLFFFRVLHSHFSTDFNISTHFGLSKSSTFIFLISRIIQFKMELISKMAILRLSIRPSEPCIYAIFKPTVFKFWIHIEDYMSQNVSNDG
jgi:hypothetical protein